MHQLMGKPKIKYYPKKERKNCGSKKENQENMNRGWDIEWYLKDILASQQNSLQMHVRGVFVLIQATRKIVQISIHSNLPLIVPMSLKRHHVVLHFLQSSPPYEYMGMLMHYPILVTTKQLGGIERRHRLRFQSCQRLKKLF